MSDGELILVAGALLAAGLLASLLARRLRLPGLVLFLAVGMIIGSDGLSWIDFNNYQFAQTIGIIALALILFEGGLSAGFEEIRPVLRPALSLATVGTLVTAMITGFISAWILDLPLLEGLLIGAVLSSTDGAAVFALLRGSTLRRRLARTLEGEAGFNDPVAVLLVLGFIKWIEEPSYGALDMLWEFVMEMAIGGAIGVAVGAGAVWAFRHARLDTAGLYPVASITAAALAFGAADALHGSGFLAVYLAGLALGSGPIPARATVVAFHEGMAWVAQIAMFLTLGLLVFPSTLLDYWWQGTAIALVVIVLSRPVATVRRHRVPGLQLARAGAPGLGRAAGRGARRAGHLPGHRQRPPRQRAVQHRLLRRGDLDDRPGRHVRARSPSCCASPPTSRRCPCRCWRPATSARWAPMSSSTRSATTTRSSGGACASWACRATRWST